MTRKSEKKDDTVQSEGRDYMKLKRLIEEFVEGGCHDYDDELDDVLLDTAKTGVVRMPWKLLKPVLSYKLDKCLNESFDSTKSDDPMQKQLMDLMEKFEGPPFTIQRLCELLLDPLKHYKRKDRFMRALERNLLVVTTQEPDLVWMRIPKLSQLLEVKPKPLVDKTPSLPTPEATLLDKEPVMMEPSIRDAKPISPIRKFPRSLSPRSRTPPPDLDMLPVTGRGWEGFMETRLSREPYFPRKRSSSFRREEEVELQEADSTVSDHPMGQEVSKKACHHEEDDETTIISALMGGFEEDTPPENGKKACPKEKERRRSCDDSMVSSNISSLLPAEEESPRSSKGVNTEEMEVN